MIYVDAAESDIEAWFITRFLQFWEAAKTDPASFYAQWAALDAGQVTAVARMVWSRINLPNLREHIVAAKAEADIVVRKSADHRMELVKS